MHSNNQEDNIQHTKMNIEKVICARVHELSPYYHCLIIGQAHHLTYGCEHLVLQQLRSMTDTQYKPLRLELPWHYISRIKKSKTDHQKLTFTLKKPPNMMNLTASVLKDLRKFVPEWYGNKLVVYVHMRKDLLAALTETRLVSYCRLWSIIKLRKIFVPVERQLKHDVGYHHEIKIGPVTDATAEQTVNDSSDAPTNLILEL